MARLWPAAHPAIRFPSLRVFSLWGEQVRMKTVLKLLFAFIFVFMVVLTVRTSLRVSLWAAIPAFAANPWAVATLYDAYFGFLTFFCWVAWRERSLGIKVLWFVLIMALGNIAMSAYVLLQLFGLKREQGVSSLFEQKAR